MKKVLFTIPMFVIVALFPVYLVAELNHETGCQPVNHSPSELKQKESRNEPTFNAGSEAMTFSLLKMNAYYLNH